jgi:hypothetical protein
MRFTKRDLLWLIAVIALVAVAIVEFRAARIQTQQVAQRQAEMAAASAKQAELTASFAQLQAKVDDYEHHHTLIRSFLLMHLKPQN